MHVNILVQLKSYYIEFLKVELTHPDNAIDSQITPAMYMLLLDLDWPKQAAHDQQSCSIFDPELEQPKICKRKPVRKPLPHEHKRMHAMNLYVKYSVDMKRTVLQSCPCFHCLT